MAAEQLSRGRLILVFAGILLAQFLAALDQTIVGTAMPRIIAELNGLELYAWVVTAYLVGSTVMTPISGKLGDLFGRKPLLIGGMIGFVLASALCGQAQNMAELIAFRGIQGIFAGILITTVFASVADLFPPARRVRIQGIFGGVFGIASVVGPTVGGYLTDNVGWRWVFYVNVPVGIIAITFVLLTMPPVQHRASWRDIDFAGAFALAAGLVPLLIGFSITNTHAWTSPEVLALIAAGLLVLVGFFFLERRTDHPIVPFELFKNRVFAISVLVGFFVAVGMFGAIIFVPLLYQGVLGIAATNSGLLLTPMMLGLIVGSVITGQLMLRIKHYRFIGTFGMVLLMIGLYLLSRVNVGTPEVEVVRDLLLVGFGVGTSFPLYLNAVQSAVDVRYTGVVTSQLQFFRNIGATIGTAILGSILSSRLLERARSAVDALGVPPQLQAAIPQGNSAQSLFDPAKIAAAKAAVPPQFQPLFDRILDAIRGALGATLSDIFLYAMAIVSLALIASVFLEDVPIRGRRREQLQRAPAFGD